MAKREMHEAMQVARPEPQAQGAEPIEAHIVKRRGKFHGHVVMSDRAEHHLPPHGSMGEAHAAMAPQLGFPQEAAQVGEGEGNYQANA